MSTQVIHGGEKSQFHLVGFFYEYKINGLKYVSTNAYGQFHFANSLMKETISAKSLKQSN